ncbi:PREDICTED: probable LIM domain-containing serine/threonine-protein kinase DDB_G0287001 [Nicotiana attenuata]|uniref:Serinethreonine-protein kinase sty17 n=1 Tax=Nicotiana attenuata TaxID=49451 RepID=A0A1J6IHY6_NICAT|nr:PREDICTED: probable LIM domain-containing serine/threonine-protein kinase DDB_G0287001 [Nicotiana attenuata]OIT00144.1 serinethreonine-protein kinase sty17 [Nicotiana attenuata]
MAAALECWSSRTSTDEDMVEQVLMRTNDRSEAQPENASSSGPSNAGSDGGFKESSAMQKRFQRLSRNVSEAIASLKNSLNIDSVRESTGPPSNRVETCRKHVWGSVVRSLTQLYPGSQLPEKLVSNIRKHYDSLPLSYAQAGFEMKEVFLHIKLMEQASVEDQPAIMIEELFDDDVAGVIFKLTFACNCSISWPAMSGALDSASICCKKIQIFEKKSFTLGVVMLLVQSGGERMFRSRIENAIKSAVKKPKSTSMKLPFGLCGCQEENTRRRELGEIEENNGQVNYRNGFENLSSEVQLQIPLPGETFTVSVDEWQTVQSCGDEIGRWLLSSDNLEFADQIGPNTFRGAYKGKKVGIEKLKGCDKGNAYEFELRKDLLELMTCGHKGILQLFGVCIDENHGLCVVTKLMEGGTVHDLLLKKKKLQTKEIMRIAIDIAEGIKFMNDHGVAYRDLNTQRILLDKQGNACLGDMGILAACNSVGEAMEYETDGYRWLAPEIIAGDPESVTETWMSNVYSFGMIIWEMVTGEVAYSAYSPVQAAVGIAACGLRPEIPKDCPQILTSLMIKCWNNCPSKRPQFTEILSTLIRPGSSSGKNLR